MTNVRPECQCQTESANQNIDPDLSLFQQYKFRFTRVMFWEKGDLTAHLQA